MKRCNTCGEEKPESEFYSGRGDCKVCKRKRSHDTYAPKKAATRERRLATYENGLKRCKQCGELKATTEYGAHPTHWDRLSHVCKACDSAAAKVYYAATADQRRASGRQWYQSNRQAKRSKDRAWRRRNPDASRAIWHRYKGRKLNAGGTFTAEQWEQLKSYYAPEGACLCCGEVRPLTVDHVIPLYQGGTNDIGNLQPLCQPCNSAKGDERCTDYRPDLGAFARASIRDKGLHQPP